MQQCMYTDHEVEVQCKLIDILALIVLIIFIDVLLEYVVDISLQL